ncbi:DUF1367 family protein [bacterium]|nr:DUF1367 family protein [bacterium]
MEFWAQLHTDGIHPIYNSDSDTLSKLKLNTDYKFVVTKPRNIGHHKKYFSLLNLTFDNQELFNNIDDMRAYLQMKAGYYKRIQTPDGEMIIPESISFASKDQLAFEEIYSRVMDQVCLFLDLTNDEIMENIVNYI